MSHSLFQEVCTVQLKLSATLATVDESKKSMYLIDSGTTHHCFHSKLSFVTYDIIKEQQIKSDTGNSVALGKGTINPPFKNVIVDAYHVPKILKNIHSVELLSRRNNVLFSSDLSNKNKCNNCIITRRSDNAVVSISNLSSGLYKIAYGDIPTVCKNSKKRPQYPGVAIFSTSLFSSGCSTTRSLTGIKN